MKAILISIRPKWVSKILNGEKTIEIRKSAPKCELPIDVYIYCTKNKLHYNVGALMFNKDDCFKRSVDGTYKYGDSVELMGYSPDYPYDKNNFLNGKIVAKFTLKKVEEIKPFSFMELLGDSLTEKQREIADKSCVGWMGIHKYANGKPVYLWHISDLEIFDEPKELNEFYSLRLDKDVTKLFDYLIQLSNGKWFKRLDKAPQSWCYVEEKE